VGASTPIPLGHRFLPPPPHTHTTTTTTPPLPPPPPPLATTGKCGTVTLSCLCCPFTLCPPSPCRLFASVMEEMNRRVFEPYRALFPSAIAHTKVGSLRPRTFVSHLFSREGWCTSRCLPRKAVPHPCCGFPAVQKLDRLDALLFGLIEKRRKEVADGSRAKAGQVDLLGEAVCAWERVGGGGGPLSFPPSAVTCWGPPPPHP
jgi:hypothetical protein